MNKKIIALLLLALLGICTESPTKALDANKKSQQFSLENYANISEPMPLKKGMPYKEARQILIKQGWKPNFGGKPNLKDRSVKELFDLGYQEIKDCSGTGYAPCRFEFINQKGEVLVVVTAGLNRVVRNWWIEKTTNTIQQKSSSNTIIEGRYSINKTRKMRASF